MADIFNMLDTWNAGATTFTAIKMNVTNTASAVNSKLIDLQIAGVTVFNVDKSGSIAVGTNVPNTYINADLGAAIVSAVANTSAQLSIVGNKTLDVGFADLVFGNEASSGTVAKRRLSMIRAAREGADTSSNLSFWTSNAGTLAEAMAITKAGNVGVGISAPLSKLVVSGGGLNKAAFTVATLPAAPVTGDEVRVTNALAPALGAAVVGGGAAQAAVWWNGAAWNVTAI